MSNITYVAAQFLKYKFLSKHSKGHGIHSPFVYDFVEKVLLNKSNRAFYEQNKKYEKELKKNKTNITKIDLGAKKQANSSYNTTYSSIAKQSTTPFKYRCLLSKMVEYYKHELIIEFGTSLGLTTNILSNSTDVQVITIEGCPNLHKVAIDNFSKWGNKNVLAIQTDFDLFVEDFTAQQKTVLIYIDGNHSGTATKQYINNLWDKIPTNSIIVIGDIYWSRDMTEAWKQISKPTNNCYSVDLFTFGILFKRNFCEGQHFRIKY
ncbi:MAG: class I SAM-dependent methyltransferase [Salinivirgaceae bacterium]|jgi:predicted O-methyltransferase YrrM|nr:class I SAM-dependent methyltransferase [Bacteroidales bacterium]